MKISLLSLFAKFSGIICIESYKIVKYGCFVNSSLYYYSPKSIAGNL